jgi:hypothetical protein
MASEKGNKMAEFVSFDPLVEVRGEVLMAWLAGTQDKLLPYLQDHGISDVQAKAWYPLQAALDALQEFGLSYSLFNTGLLIPEHTAFPPGLNTLHDALQALDATYHQNHRNGESGHYHVDFIDERMITVVAENPYPCELDFGLLHHLADQFAPDGAKVQVTHDQKEPCRKDGYHSCTFHLTW